MNRSEFIKCVKTSCNIPHFLPICNTKSNPTGKICLCPPEDGPAKSGAPGFRMDLEKDVVRMRWRNRCRESAAYDGSPLDEKALWPAKPGVPGDWVYWAASHKSLAAAPFPSFPSIPSIPRARETGPRKRAQKSTRGFSPVCKTNVSFFQRSVGVFFKTLFVSSDFI